MCKKQLCLLYFYYTKVIIMTFKRKTVGSYTVTTCNKCKNDMNHVITALEADLSIAQVKCMVCGSIHKYKKSSLEVKQKTIKTIKKTSSSNSYYSLFNEAKELATNKVALKYSFTNKYTKNNLIDHASLGEGVVISTYEFKVEVLFKDGVKILVHNKK